MNLTKVRISELTAHPENYNRHPDRQIAELGKSLELFGQFKNIVIRKGIILAGHGLVEATRKRGDEFIHALVRDDLSDDLAKALLAADNLTALLSEPDQSALDELLKSVDMDVPGVIEYETPTQGDLDDFFVKDESEKDEPEPDEKIITCPYCKEKFSQ